MNNLGVIYSTVKNAEKHIVIDSENVEISGNFKLTNSSDKSVAANNISFNGAIINNKLSFNDSDELGNSPINYSIVNDSLTANNDASLNIVNINNSILFKNEKILEKRSTSHSIFKCANYYEEFNATIRYAVLVRTNGNNKYALINAGTEYKIFDSYTKKNFPFTHGTSSCQAQFDYWTQPHSQYGEVNTTNLVFDELLFGDWYFDTRGSISIYRRGEDNFNWNYESTLQNYNSYPGNFNYRANRLYVSPDGSRLFFTGKNDKFIHMIYRGERNRSFLDVFAEYQSLAAGHNWNSLSRISYNLESTFINGYNDEYVHYEFDSNTDGTILTATTWNNTTQTINSKYYSNSVLYILYSPTLKSPPEPVFTGNTGNVHLNNAYFLFQKINFTPNSDGIFNNTYGYPAGSLNPNIDPINGPIGRIIGTNTTVYLENATTEFLLYSKQIISSDGLTLVVNDRGYNGNDGCMIIFERPNIDVSFTYTTFFQGADFPSAGHGVTFGTNLAIRKKDEIYAGSNSSNIIGHNFIINKIGDQWIETRVELPRNSYSTEDGDGQGFGQGICINMSSDGTSIAGGYGINGGYTGVEYYVKESNQPFITSYGAIHNALRADFIYNNFAAELTSDDRYKIQEKIINDGLETIRKLNPKKYLKTTLEYASDYSGNIQPLDSVFEESGLIAQELLDISNLNYAVSNNDNKYSVRYNDIFVHGLAAIKELDALVASQKEEIITLKNALNEVLTSMNKQIIA